MGLYQERIDLHPEVLANMTDLVCVPGLTVASNLLL